MNNKIVIAGSILITLVFLVVFFGWTLNLRRNTLLDSGLNSAPVTNVVPLNDTITQQQIKRSEKDVYSTMVVKRGVVVNYSQGQLSLLEKTADELIELDTSSLTEYKCWPGFFTTSSGDQVSIYDAFMPMDPISVLYIKGETKKTIDQLASDLIASRKVIAKVTDASGSTTVNDLAILDCDTTP